MEEKRAVGATVAVVAADGIVHARGYGLADLETRTEARADRTLFYLGVYLGAAGKLFTWTAVMQLVEAGEITLDVTRYLDFAIAPTYPEPITGRGARPPTPGACPAPAVPHPRWWSRRKGLMAAHVPLVARTS